MLGEEAAEHSGEGPQGLGSDGDAAVVEAGGVGEFLTGAVELGQGAVDTVEKGGTEAVKSDPSAMAVEQRNAELGFEPTDRATERRLSDAQLLGGATDVFMAGNDPEVAQRQQVHAPYSSMPVQV